MRTLSTLTTLIMLGLAGAYSVADINTGRGQVEIERVRTSIQRLTQELNGLAPVSAPSSSLFGTSPNFLGFNYCWSFESGSPDLYHRVAGIVNKFHGNMRWSFNLQFNQKGACLAAMAISNEFYSAIADSKSLSKRTEVDITENQVSLADEIDKFRIFMESELNVAARETKPVSEHLPTVNQYEPSIFDVTLIRDVRAFQWPTPTSEVDQRLDLGLTYDEWYALFFKVLGKSEGQATRRPVDFQGAVDGYPMLSRLNDIHDNVAIEKSEVGELKEECLRLEVISTDNTTAKRCIRKLLLICSQAEDLQTGIYFSGE